MRFYAFRVVRAATVALPSVWFVYVVHSIFFVDDTSNASSGSSHDRAVGGGRRARAGDLGLAGGGLPGFRPAGDASLQGRAEGPSASEDVRESVMDRRVGAEAEADGDRRDGKKARLVRILKRNAEKRKNGTRGQDQSQGQGEVRLPPQGDSDAERRKPGPKVFRKAQERLRGDHPRSSQRERGPDDAIVHAIPAPHAGVQRLDAAVNDSGWEDVIGGNEDPYAGVTYPPFVEWLPSGSKGQGPKGLTVNKQQLSEEGRKLYDEKWERNSFNQYASDLIPVRRELPDFRAEECKRKGYPSVLPNISVVIIFHNEAWSVLLRSVHSILSRTGPGLLVDIILVDDVSTMEHLKKPLDKYFREYPKVKIVRCPVRGGLTKARLRGFEVSTGEVVVFLDSHIECTEGWAEPLLWMITEDHRTVPFPMIDMITTNDLSYIAHHSSPYGIFSMNSLTFKWTSSLQRPPRLVTEPKPSPTMPGGLFAIHRKWFTELGKYDPELDYWGGENMELSFKVWMCGGSVVIAECSHIGHIFRQNNPIKWTQNLGNRNYVRVAMVWMDEYKNHYLERTKYKLGDYGDISDRVAVRNRLQCHDFNWYVHNVYPELLDQLVMNATYAGEVRHDESNNCLDKMDESHTGPQLFPCHHQGANQFWYFLDNKYFQIESVFLCVRGGGDVRLCTSVEKDEFSYNTTNRQLLHVKSGLCLQKAAKDGSNFLGTAPCSPASQFQTWTLDKREPFKYR